MSFILLLSLCTLLQISIGAVTTCYECVKEEKVPSGMCCFDHIECGSLLCDPTVTTQEPTTTEDPNATTQDPNDAATTEDPNNTTQDPNDDPPRDPGICKYWSSESTTEDPNA
eukprot:466082_1